MSLQVEVGDKVYKVDHVVSALPSYSELLCVLCSVAVSMFNPHTSLPLSLPPSTASPIALASLLPSSHSDLSDLLASIEAVTVGVVCLEYKGQPLPAEYREVGRVAVAMGTVSIASLG